MIQDYKQLTNEEYLQLKEIKDWGINHNKEQRQLNNRGIDLGIEFL